jgi:sugar lactone lactonase YvrE
MPGMKPKRRPRLAPACHQMAVAPPRSRLGRSARQFPPARRIALSGSPEDVVVDAQGRVIGGAEGGRILRVDPERGSEEVIGDTGGRPLGLELLGDGRLLVCDADKGLLCLDPVTGELETLVRVVGGVALRFCSNASAASDGTIWFTESTRRFGFEHYLGALLEHRPSGRLLRRDPDGTVEVVLGALYFANGVTLTQDESALLFAETGAARISRLELRGPRAGRIDVIADNLPGYPDNLSRVRDGRFWAAIPNPRDALLDRLGTAPGVVRELVWRIPDRLRPSGERTVWVMAFDEHGNVLADLQQPRADFHMVTGVAEHDRHLYLASVQEHALLAVALPEDLSRCPLQSSSAA